MITPAPPESKRQGLVGGIADGFAVIHRLYLMTMRDSRLVVLPLVLAVGGIVVAGPLVGLVGLAVGLLIVSWASRKK